MQKIAETKILHQKAVDYIISLANKVLAVRSSKKAGYFLNLLLKELKALKGWIEGLKQSNNSVKIAGLIRVYSATQFEQTQTDDTPVGEDYVNKVAPIRNDLDTLFEYLGQNNLDGASQVLDDSIQAIDEIMNTIQTLTQEYPHKDPEQSQEPIDLTQHFKKGDTITDDEGVFDIISAEGNKLTLMSPDGKTFSHEVKDKAELDEMIKAKNIEKGAYEKHSIPINQISTGDILEVEGELWAVVQKKPGTAKYLTVNMVDDRELVFDPRGLKQVEILTQDGVEKLIEEFIKENNKKTLPPVIKEEYDYLF